MKVGVVGRGTFGKKLLSKLEKFADIVFVTGKDYNVSYDIDWAFIASSNESHYVIVKEFLLKKINVFCEKPLTLSLDQTKELINLSKEMGVILYTDDVFRYHLNYQQHRSNLEQADELVFAWTKYGSFRDNIYSNLTYHDLYLLIDILGVDNLDGLEFDTNTVNKKECHFTYRGKSIKFKYDRLNLEKSKTINSFSFNNPSNDPLSDMVEQVLNKSVDVDYNHKLTLNAQKLLEEFNKFVPTVAVVGAGIFGVTTALKLDRAGLKVTLFDKNTDILQNASGINQYRVHRGYHYPRSKDTAISAKEGTLTFLEEYDCLSKASEHYYCIASERSLIDADQYVDFLDKVQLEYEVVTPSSISTSGIDLAIKAQENLFNPYKLKELCLNKISESNIKLRLGKAYTKSNNTQYDYVVNCTYSLLNSVLDKKDQQDYQYEVCEKPVLKLSSKYRGKSIVIMDGPFTCIDPLGDTEYHVMGSVVHAIHHTNVGKKPIIPSNLRPMLNKGIVTNPEVTNVEKFLDSASVFFPEIKEAQHIGSMFTVRTVLPSRDHDDARPSIVKKHSDKLYSLFSGKISTCVDSAEELVKYIKRS